MDAAHHMQSTGNGRYTFQRELGRGGMATVHLAYDSVLDRSVAVKLLHPELGHDTSFRERFRREAKTVAKLNHPNVVSVYDSGEETVGGRHAHYIVMEYVEGQSLRDLLDRAGTGRPVPLRMALDLAWEILLALQASHELGLVHRDVKPANVMVNQRGTVKVMDFGIARALQSPHSVSMTQTGTVIGTPQYLSPEQALGRTVDPRSDLYSVGCLLYELVTGTVPFAGDSALSIAYAHVQQAPRIPSTLNPALPPAVDALVLRAMQKDPSARFPGAAEMLAAVDEVRRAVSFGPPPGVPVPVPRPAPAPSPEQTRYDTRWPPHSGPPHGGGTLPAPATGPHRSRRSGYVIGAALALVVGAAIWFVASSPWDRPSHDRGGSPAVSTTGNTTPSATTRPPAADDGPQPSSTAPDGIRSGDPNLTMNPSECRQEALPGGSVAVPFFKLHHIDSVRKCASAGGWKLIEKEQDERMWGKGIVVSQAPYASFVDEKNRVVTVWVSSGHE
ncbi:protein kinase domain-containing protein [Streptomyces sp. NPDC055607]